MYQDAKRLTKLHLIYFSAAILVHTVEEVICLRKKKDNKKKIDTKKQIACPGQCGRRRNVPEIKKDDKIKNRKTNGLSWCMRSEK